MTIIYKKDEVTEDGEGNYIPKSDIKNTFDADLVLVLLEDDAVIIKNRYTDELGRTPHSKITKLIYDFHIKR